ncbi:hypothetical protein LCGC14_1820880 [marine sediment metagenome]|uniref:Uncharacterized protein n=1 Tax=marine sediment metagenome TaxID=412755 RepID=A0A0F9JIK0_9ZZZZ
MKHYPECEKLQGLEVEHRAIMEFHDYLASKGFVICEYIEDDLIHVSKSAQALIFDTYGIDPVKLEAERRQILEDVRGE